MADQPINFGVLHQGDRTAQALHRLSAVAAKDERRHAPAVQVEDHLLFVLESLSDHLDQAS